MLEFCTLGTGGTLPIPERALSSLYVRVNGRSLLIDCGEGTQVGIRRLGWGFRCLDGMLLTHYHGDHCTGIAGLLLSLEKAGKDEPFHIWGPRGLKRVVEGLCVIVPQLSFPVMLHELPAEGGDVEMIGLKIRAFPVDHGGIPCFGYRMALDRGAVFDPEKAKALNVPMKDWKRLQQGEAVHVGLKRILPGDVTGAPRKGITLVFSTDTRPCETLEKNCADADLLILEGMYGTEDKMPQALKNHHMLFWEAAEIARKTTPGGLLLTHFSTSLEDPEEYLPETRTIFERTWAAKDGETVVMRYPEGKEKAWISLS
ncbi:ribonuclease Z [Clostridiales bacterium FE2010]|nr:ribonuclease Z [Clostridiales bacterium FE2010]